jgi:predicted transcriptional regulator
MANSTNFRKDQFLIVPNLDIVLKLRGASLNIYLALIAHANPKGQCYPSYDRLSEVTDYKRRQCIEAINQLTELGLLKRIGRASKSGRQTSNSYQLMVIHTGAVERTPRSAVERTLPSAVERTPINYTHKELDSFNSKEMTFKQKRDYAIASERDRALAKREVGRASASNKGKSTTVGIGELLANRFA